MHRSITLSTLLVLSLLISPSAVHALDISITPDGGINVYSDTVLGKDSEYNTSPEPYIQKRVNPAEKQQLRVKPNQKSLEVEYVRRDGVKKQVIDSEETDRLRLNMPAKQSEEQRLREMAKMRANASDTSVQELERQVQEQQAERKLQMMRLDPEKAEQRKLFYEEKKEERQERNNEQLQLENSLGPDGQELNLESRGIRAALRDKQVTLDPETNSLILTTKDGEERVLTTLPDQAVERMLEIRGVDGIDADNLELREEEGKLRYVAKARRVKRLFGMFERPIETELSVDDQSGQVTETLEEKPTIIGRFLDRMSF